MDMTQTLPPLSFSCHTGSDRRLAPEELEPGLAPAGHSLAVEAARRVKRSFLANVNHEIRTPMNALIGLTRQALQSAANAEQKEQLAKVVESAENLMQILGDILDMSRIEANKLELVESDFDLAQALDILFAMSAPKAAAKELKFLVHVDPALPRRVKGDALRLSQVLMNFVGNAIKFTERGSVRVRVRSIGETDSDIVLRCDIEDTGIGIDAEAHGRIFEDFEQADNSLTRKYSGLGLGLAINQRLVRLMGGEIGLSSLPGRGSAFWFTVLLGKAGAGI